ncbi:MAG TPA: septum formation initiator family protein [Segeticoccus sp.]|nr:septum formation initiator family protein [Segeticoccus sp.]
MSGRPSISPLRLAILVGILVILSITLVPTIHSYLQQRGEVSALREKIDHQKQHVADLEQQRQRWEDPHYVEQQARERLKFVYPGEKAYTVIDDRGKRAASTGERGVAEVSRSTQHHRPWYAQVWTSVQVADEGAAQQAATQPKKVEPVDPKPSKPLPPIRDDDGK